MTEPVFQPPIEQVEDLGDPVDLLSAPQALESLRDSGFNLSSAVGEAIDNSIEAGATLIRVELRKSKDKKSIEAVAIADNGSGIRSSVLSKVLQVGFSTRFNSRKSLGRFGMGLKTAGLSLAERIDVITRPQGSGKFYSTYLDMQAIHDKRQAELRAVSESSWPKTFAHLVTAPDGSTFESGTLVLWHRIDQKRNASAFTTGIQQRESDLRKFIARAYRRFLTPEKGIAIELNGGAVTLHDPIFLMANPRIAAKYPDREPPRGEVIDEGEIDVVGHKIQIVVTVCPREFRPESGAGGKRDSEGRDIRDLHISDNQGRLSMLRNGREIYYDIVPRLLPGGVDKIDRYIGIEVSFPGELDEFFRVMHIKRMPEPIDKLKEELKTWLERPVKRARAAVRTHWSEVEKQSRQKSQSHDAARKAVDTAEREAPRGRAGTDVSEKQVQEKIDAVLANVLGEHAHEQPERAERLRTSLENGRMNIDVGSWPGAEMMDITHLNAASTVILNLQHQFMKDIYLPISEVASGEVPLDEREFIELARRVEVGLDLLFLAYAKAENMHDTPERFANLRTFWGSHTQDYLRTYQAGREE